MKKIAYFFTLIIFSLFFCSCSMNVDEMINKLNGQVYEDTGDGNYWTENGPNISKALIPNPVYPVKEGGQLRIEVTSEVFDYTWTLKDNKTGTVYNLEGFYIVYVGSPYIMLTADRDYTLTLLVTNRNNVQFTDSATIKVMK